MTGFFDLLGKSVEGADHKNELGKALGGFRIDHRGKFFGGKLFALHAKRNAVSAIGQMRQNGCAVFEFKRFETAVRRQTLFVFFDGIPKISFLQVTHANDGNVQHNGRVISSVGV